MSIVLFLYRYMPAAVFYVACFRWCGEPKSMPIFAYRCAMPRSSSMRKECLYDMLFRCCARAACCCWRALDAAIADEPGLRHHGMFCWYAALPMLIDMVFMLMPTPPLLIAAVVYCHSCCLLIMLIRIWGRLYRCCRDTAMFRLLLFCSDAQSAVEHMLLATPIICRACREPLCYDVYARLIWCCAMRDARLSVFPFTMLLFVCSAAVLFFIMLWCYVSLYAIFRVHARAILMLRLLLPLFFTDCLPLLFRCLFCWFFVDMPAHFSLATWYIIAPYWCYHCCLLADAAIMPRLFAAMAPLLLCRLFSPCFQRAASRATLLSTMPDSFEKSATPYDAYRARRCRLRYSYLDFFAIYMMPRHACLYWRERSVATIRACWRYFDADDLRRARRYFARSDAAQACAAPDIAPLLMPYVYFRARRCSARYFRVRKKCYLRWCAYECCCEYKSVWVYVLFWYVMHAQTHEPVW